MIVHLMRVQKLVLVCLTNRKELSDFMHAVVRQLSGLQAEVLVLYRRAFRVARAKEPPLRRKITEMAKAQMEKYKGMSSREIMRIEHLIRKGHKQLDVLSSSAVTDIAGWS